MKETVRKRFTLVELLVVIAIITILSSLVFAALVLVKKKSKETYCLNNTRGIAISVLMFAGDNDGRIKPSFEHAAVLEVDYVYDSYVDNARLFECPSEESENAKWLAFKKTFGRAHHAVFSPFTYTDAYNIGKGGTVPRMCDWWARWRPFPASIAGSANFFVRGTGVRAGGTRRTGP